MPLASLRVKAAARAEAQRLQKDGGDFAAATADFLCRERQEGDLGRGQNAKRAHSKTRSKIDSLSLCDWWQMQLLACLLAAPPPSDKKAWRQVDLPLATESPILFDIEFDSKNPQNGFIVGNRGTFFETKDAGKNWAAKSFANLDAEDEINYRFTKMSFKEGEGWIIGKPAILLHTRDSGASWERVPLSPKLPGDPYGIVALGPGRAELSTSAGAIYTTDNSGRNWKAEVRETIDATLNRVSSSGVHACTVHAVYSILHTSYPLPL